jgi:hypothetical protein
VQVETNKTAQGNVITVGYSSGGADQGGLVSKLVPNTTISVTRRESGSPGFKSRTYVGKVNAGSWSRDPGALARTWLCTAITGRSTDGGSTYEVNYQFQYREETWDETVVYMDTETGRPAVGITDGDGIEEYIIYQTANFNALGL